MERALVAEMQDYLARQAQYCVQMVEAEVGAIKALREADSVNSRLMEQIEASVSRSRALFQRISGIFEATTVTKAPTAATNMPAPLLAP